MTIIGWVIGHSIITAFWLWIIRWGGAELLEGRVASLFLISEHAYFWDAETIRIVACVILAVSLVWFVLGLFFPEMRLSRV